MKHSLRHVASVALFCSVLSLPAGLIAQSAPDLFVSGAPAGVSEAIRGQDGTVSVTIGNAGSDSTAATYDVTLYLSADETPTALEKVGDLAVSTSLAPGETRVIQVPVRVPSLQMLGAHVWLAVVDAADVIAESDENNNVGVGNAITVLPTPPDLIVSSLPSGPVQVALGTTVNVSLAISNVGVGPSSDPFDISVYLSQDDTIDSTDLRVGRVTLPDILLPGEVRQINVLSSVPVDFPEGIYQWIAVVNADGEQMESDGTNNATAGTPTTVALIQPDLSLLSPLAGASAVFRGVTTDVTVEITNSGAGATAQAFDIVVYISEDTFAGNGDDVRIGDIAVTTELGIGETRALSIPVRVSAVQATGVYHWIVVVDDGAFVTEGDEANNSSVGTQVSILAQPSDLLVTAAPTGPGLVIRNSFHTVPLEISNVGAGTTTGAFQVSVFLSSDDISGNEDDVRIGNVTVSTLMIENQVMNLSVPITIASDQPTGTFNFLAVVDATSVEIEVNEQNNHSFSASQVIVSANSPDLAVITDPFGPTKILRDGNYSVTGEIQNQSGGVMMDDFTVTAVLSLDDEIGNADDMAVGSALISGGLISGEIVSVSVPVSIPVGAGLGGFRWGVWVDSDDVVDEVNEANNSRVGSSVTVVAFPPDLVVGADLVGPDEVSRGRLYNIPVTVENAGQGATITGFEIAVYLSQNASIGDADDILVGTAVVDEVFEPAASRVIEVPVIIPADQVPAQFNWAVIINPEGLIVEGNRTNNTAIGNLVAFPVLDLPESMSFGSVTLGQSKTRVLEIVNTGTAALSFDVQSLSPLVAANPPQVEGLAPGDTQVIAITVTPTETGTFDGDVRIISELRGTQIISLGGQSVISNRDRVRVDLDSSIGIQDVLERRVGVNQNVDLELHVFDLPTVSTVAIQIAYDPASVALTTNGLVTGSFVSNDVLVQTALVSPGLVEVAMVAQSGSLGQGDGHLGTLTFRTLGGFYDPSGEGTTAVEAVQIRYIDSSDATESTIDVSASIGLRLDLACWGDFDADGSVGFADFLSIVNAFNTSPASPGWTLPSGSTGIPLRRLDANGDDIVDFGDFVIFQSVFGAACQ